MNNKKNELKAQILNFFYQKGALSLIELSDLLNVSLPTVNTFLKGLLEENIVEELGAGNSTGGRKPMLYNINKTAHYVLAIDIGRRTTRIAIFNSVLTNVTGIESFQIPIESSISFIQSIHTFAQEVIQKYKIKVADIYGVGICMPGLINTKEGINHIFFNNLRKTVKELFQELFQKPVFIENDANAHALGELKNGAAYRKKNALVLKYDWGIGLGIIIDEKLYRGTDGLAGEFSHIPIVKDGVLCECGKHGCLETIASGKALYRMVIKDIQEGSKTNLKTINPIENIVLVDIVKAALKGDQFSIRMLSKIGKELGGILASLIHTFNPEIVVIGGTISKSERYIITPITEALNYYAMPLMIDNMSVQVSALGYESSLLGVSTIVMEDSLKERTTNNKQLLNN